MYDTLLQSDTVQTYGRAKENTRPVVELMSLCHVCLFPAELKNTNVKGRKSYLLLISLDKARAKYRTYVRVSVL